jgi:hypothetical protein
VATTGDAQHRWWLCCWGHVFEHDPVAEGDELQCPAFFDDEEPCGTYFVFEPFASRQEAGTPSSPVRRGRDGHRGPTEAVEDWSGGCATLRFLQNRPTEKPD